MKGWQAYKLNELGKVNRGKSKHRPRNEPSLYGGKYPFIQTGEIKASNFYISEYSQTYSDKGLAQSKLWKKGTLCITIAANIAETAILNIDACFPDSIIGFVADKNKSDVKFIKYHFDLLKLHLQSISQGTTQDNLSQEKLLKFDFKVPIDVINQERISSILSAYDDLIEVNNQRIKLLEQTARELYKEWFVRLRFPGYKKVKFKKGIPEGWEIRTIKSIAIINKKNLNSKSEITDINYIDISSVSTGRIENRTTYSRQDAPGRAKRIVNDGDTIFSTVRPENRAYSMITNPIHNTIASTGFAVLSPIKKEYSEFIYFIIASDAFIDEMTVKARGSAYPQISFDDIARHTFLFPKNNNGVLANFHAVTNPMFQQIETLQQQNTQLRQIRDRLLPRLISGKLQVKMSES